MDNVWVQERYIDYSNNDGLFTSWFKNKVLVAEYFYTGTPEDIFNRDWVLGYGNSKEDTEERLLKYRAFYTKGTNNALRISGNYFIVRHGAGRGAAYRLESVVKDKNIYTLNLSDPFYYEAVVTLVDNGDGVTITQYTITRSGSDVGRNKAEDMLNIKYVPYDKDKSEKTEAAVREWSTEQLKILGSRLQ